MSIGTFQRHEHVRDPNLPKPPLGGSRNQMLYLLVGISVLAIIAVAFWFQATSLR